MRSCLLLEIPLLLLAGSLAARAADGVLFYASFDRWRVADMAAGGRAPFRTVGQPRLADGKLGKALALDGRSYLEFPAGANVGAKGGTVCVWFRPANWGARTYDNLFGFSDGNVNALHFERSHPGGQFRLVLGGPDTADGAKTRSLFSQEPLRNGEWVHIAAAWDAESGRAEVFFDGKSVAQAAGPGPVPLDPPSILVGCGFGRLGRAIAGLLDDLVILDHAATAEEVQAIMQGVQTGQTVRTLGNEAVCVVVEPDSGSVTFGDAGETGGRFIVGPARPHVRVGDREVTWPRFEGETEAPAVAPRLGKATHHVLAARDETSRLDVSYHVQVQGELPVALIWLEVRNAGQEPASISQIGLLRTAEQGGVALGVPPQRLRIFLDSGGLGGSGTRVFAQPSAQHAARGAMVLHDLEGGSAASFSFVTFRTAGVTTRLTTGADGAPAAAQATCDYPGGYLLAPGETLTSETLAVGFYPDGHAALEKWADAVMAVNDLQPPRFRPCGYNSWYAYRLEISEDLLLQNARIMKERWVPLGLEYVQIDHGWQYKDVVGNWVPNERFPHGLQWLSGELEKLGYKLGLWLSVTNISEFAPFYTEHPEALMHNADGSPVVSAEYWFWEPHGKTYSLDPTHPVGARFYEEAGKALHDYGCRYAKNDFQTNIGHGSAVLHDKTIVHGVPVYRLGMDLLRKGMGPDVAYHACNGMLNVIAGACDVAWTHRDMGNPRGDWEAMRGWVNEFCCRHHVSGKFYWSDPDYVQVAQGTMNETQVRMAICALGGGPVTICDRLPELSEEKLALIPKCLPGYGKPARPLDLFTHLGYPQAWDLPVDTSWGKWHVVGLFNLDEQPGRIELNLSQLELEAGKPYVVYDFFAERLLGEVTPGAELELAVRVPVPATSVRLLRIAPKQTRPFVLSTDMHLTQGGVELPEVVWDDRALTLRGVARRAPGLSGKVLVYVPAGFVPMAEAGTFSAPVLSVPVEFRANECGWEARFRRG